MADERALQAMMSSLRTSGVVRLIAALSLGVSLLGCNSEASPPIEFRVAPLEKILVFGGRNHFLLEVVDEAELVVRAEERVERCQLTVESRSAWETIRSLAGSGKVEVDDKLTWDPSLCWHGVVVVHIREISEDSFVMSYVEGDSRTLAAVEAVDRIFESCDLSDRVELQIQVRPD